MTKKALDRQNLRSEAMKDPSMVDLDRRQLLTRALFGSVGAAATLAALPSEAEASGRRRVVFDVACLGNTWTQILAPGADAPLDSHNQRGTTFIVEGNLYRRGTIPVGEMNWNPASATPIGHWFCRGWFINRTGRSGEKDRPEPFCLVHQDYVIGRFAPDNLFPPDQITTSGIVGAIDLMAAGGPTLSVVGGTGRYLAAQGAVTLQVIGFNTTGAPNFPCDFRLEKRDR
jgi:hypothetical protein